MRPLVLSITLGLVAAFRQRSPSRARVRLHSLTEDVSAAFAGVVQDAGESADALASSGRSALQKLEAPTRKQEAFRFSKVPDLLKAFQWRAPPSSARSAAGLTDEALQQLLPSGPRVVVVDGLVRAELSEVGDLALEALSAPEAQELLGDINELDENPRIAQGSAPFMAVSLAVAPDAVVLRAPKGYEAAEVLQVLHVITEGSEPTMLCPRLCVIVEEDARLRVVERFLSVGEGEANLVNSVGKAKLAKGAYLEHAIVNELAQRDSLVQSVNASVGDEAVYNVTALSVGASVARFNLQVDLSGVGSIAECVGVQLTGPEQAHETYASIAHIGEDCESIQQQRNVIAKAGEAVFRGRIDIGQDAAGTDSDQLCRTLLLEDGARITAMPSLTVINENVAAAHGATVADLDEESIFYMRSRGLSLMDSRKILMRGFVEEFLGRVEVAGLDERLQEKVESIAPKGDQAAKRFFQSI